MSRYFDDFGVPIPPDAADLVERLEKLLPGFEARANGSTDRVEIRGTLRIVAGASYELFLPASSPAVNEETAQRLADEARRLGIEALGIEQEIAAREDRARREGAVDGERAGYARGMLEGRREMLAEILAAEIRPEGDER